MQAKDIVLGLLMQGPMSGYDIKQEYELSLSHFFDASYGSVYPTLKQLEKLQLIDKELIIQEGKPNKNMYSITEMGKQCFLTYLDSPIQGDIYRSDILARMFFGRYSTEEQLIAQLEDAVHERKQVLAQLEDAYRGFKDQMTKPRMISLQYGLKDHKAQVEVLEQSIAYMKSEQTAAQFWGE